MKVKDESRSHTDSLEFNSARFLLTFFVSTFVSPFFCLNFLNAYNINIIEHLNCPTLNMYDFQINKANIIINNNCINTV